MTAFCLPQEEVHRVDIVNQTHAAPVGDALIVASFPKGDSAGRVVLLDDEPVVMRASGRAAFAGHIYFTSDESSLPA
jgi:hypothetical protein